MAVKISDGNGTITLRFFNFYCRYEEQLLPKANKSMLLLKSKRGNMGLEIVHPDLPFFAQDSNQTWKQTDSSVPNHWRTETSHAGVTLTDQALELIDKAAVNELLPSPARSSNYPSTSTAYHSQTASRYRPRIVWWEVNTQHSCGARLWKELLAQKPIDAVGPQ